MFEVSLEDIQGLWPNQLPDLLGRLLHLEAASHRLAVIELHVSGAITVADGGEDGRIELRDDPPLESSRLTRRLTVFQCKTSDVGPTECAAEVRKPQVMACLERGGSYVLIMTKSLNKQQIDARVNAARAAVGSNVSSPDIRIFDATQLRAWTNRFLPAVIAVQQWHGTPQVAGLRTWRDWSNDMEMSDFQFVSDQTVEDLCLELRRFLSRDRSVVRLLGLSGLGKTRLALEALRPPEMSSCVGYVDVGGGNMGLDREVISWRTHSQMEGLLVVDNCPLELHERLKRVVEHGESKFRLLTLHNDPGERPSHAPIRLDLMSEDLIRGMLREKYEDRFGFDLGRIVEYAQGFPKMAVLLARARLDGRNLGEVVDDSLLNRLLGEEFPLNSDGRKVLGACAIFAVIGLEGDREEEYQHVARAVAGIDPDDFYRCVERLISRQLLQKAGRFIRVEPLPLAVRLAAEWWRGCSPRRARAILSGELPGGLSQAICDRLARLNFLPEVQRLAGELCGDQGPFGQAEVLNSELGSRLFCALAETNPEAALGALERVFGGWSREQLLTVDPGRRNLVWLLEKLCFQEELFLRAGRLLMAFAAAENEHWGNNASGQFCQLFQVYLPGTEAPLDRRLPLLDEALANPGPEYRALSIQAMDKALHFRYASRSSGGEFMGSAPARQDWHPRSQSEIGDYLQQILQRLVAVACGDDEWAARAKSVLGNSIREVFFWVPEALDSAISGIIDPKGPIWLEAVSSIHDLISFEGQEMSGPLMELPRSWLQWLAPKDLPGRLQTVVTRAPWLHEEAGTRQSREKSRSFRALQAAKPSGRDDQNLAKPPCLQTVSTSSAEVYIRDSQGFSDLLRRPPSNLDNLQCFHDVAFRLAVTLHEEGEDGRVIDLAEGKAMALAEELAQAGTGWLEALPSLLQGEQRQGMAFGKRLGECILDPVPLIDQAMNILAGLGPERANCGVLAAFLGGLRPRFPVLVTQTLDRVATDAALHPYLVGLTSCVQPDREDLDRVLTLVRQGRIPAKSVGMLAWGGVLGHCSAMEILPFGDALTEWDKDGAWVALNILDLYRPVDERWRQARLEKLRGILMHRNLVVSEDINPINFHGWERSAIKLLESDDPALAIHLTRTILSASVSCRRSQNFKHAARTILRSLLANHREATWSLLGEALLKDDFSFYSDLRYLVGDPFGNERAGSGVLFALPDEFLLAWCQEYSEVAPLRIAGIMPLFIPNDTDLTDLTWTSLALAILEQYGDRPKVLAEIKANMGTFSWAGPVVPFYRQRQRAMEALQEHRHRAVRDWVTEYREYLQGQIDRERVADQEEAWGIR